MPHSAYASRVIAAAPDAIWPLIANFNALPAIHPAITHSELEAGATRSEPGVVRRLTLPDGVVRERLLKLDRAGWELHYVILQSPMPVADYLAVIRLTPQDNATTLVEWWANFVVTDGADADAVAYGVSEEIFATCLLHIERALCA